MARELPYNVGTLTTMLDQTGSAPNTLASIAASGGAAVMLTANAFDNSAGNYRWADFQLTLGFAVAPTAGTFVYLYLTKALDNTNFEDLTGSNTPANVVFPDQCFRRLWTVRNQTGVIIQTVERVLIPPCKFIVGVFNNTNQATATSGTTQTLKMLPYGDKWNPT